MRLENARQQTAEFADAPAELKSSRSRYAVLPYLRALSGARSELGEATKTLASRTAAETAKSAAELAREQAAKFRKQRWQGTTRPALLRKRWPRSDQSGTNSSEAFKAIAGYTTMRRAARSAANRSMLMGTGTSSPPLPASWPGSRTRVGHRGSDKRSRANQERGEKRA